MKDKYTSIYIYYRERSEQDIAYYIYCTYQDIAYI